MVEMRMRDHQVLDAARVDLVFFELLLKPRGDPAHGAADNHGLRPLRQVHKALFPTEHVKPVANLARPVYKHTFISFIAGLFPPALKITGRWIDSPDLTVAVTISYIYLMYYQILPGE